MKIFINDVDYTNHLAPGLVISSTLTEELDSATIILNFMPYTNFEPFQKVRIELEDGVNRYFLINTYVDTQITFANPILYTYTLKLISETKKLERVILPNLSIKKPIGRNTKRIIDYLNWIIMPYVKEQFAELYIDSNDAINFPFLTNNCPEIQWATPNAKSAINDLLGSIPNNPYLVRVENNRLTWVSLSQKNNEISKKGIVKIENYQQMSETANNLVFDAKNVVPNDASVSIENSIRSESGADLTTENGAFIIPNARIDRIKSLKLTPLLVYVYMDEDASNPLMRKEMKIEIDITKYVVEKFVYDTYKVSPTFNLSINAKGYKRNAIWYKQGGNSIEGLFYKDELFLTNSAPALGRIFDYEVEQYIANLKITEPNILVLQTYPDYLTNLTNGDQPYHIHFELEFYSIGDFKLKTYKSDAKSEDTSLKSQQNQQYIDMLTLEQFQRQSINRLGNEVLSISAIYHNIDEVPKLSDWYGDNYILAQSEIAYRPDYILFSGLFSKNYLVSNQYYGIQSRRRYTQFVTTGEALIREEHRVCEVKFSLIDDKPSTFPSLSIFFASYFSTRGSNHINALRLETKETNNSTISISLLQPYVYAGEKTTYLTAQCEDNVSVGKKVTIEGSHKVQEYVIYTDDYGEIKTYRIDLINHLDLYPLSLFEDATTQGEELDHRDKYMEAYYKLPEIPSNAKYDVIDINLRKDIYKDNGEIFKQTIQFNFSSDDENIIIGNVIGRENSLTDNIEHSLTFVYSNSKRLDKDNPDATGYAIPTYLNRILIGVLDNMVFLNTLAIDSGRFWLNMLSWALIDEEGNVVVGMNNPMRYEEIPHAFYINAL